MIEFFRTGDMLYHIWVTLEEIFLGTFWGILLGLVLGYVLAKVEFLEKLVMPFVIIVQTAPKISLAPLFILWMGLGIQSKVALVILVVSFPVMTNEVLAVRSIEKNIYNLMTILKANAWQRFIKIELPFSGEMLLSGMKVAVTQAMIGAVIGEMIGAKAGLGYLVVLGGENYNINLILSAVFLLSVLGLFLYKVFDILERHILTWKETEEEVVG
jgi:NitT/TauT family transport system permease protein